MSYPPVISSGISDALAACSMNSVEGSAGGSGSGAGASGESAFASHTTSSPFLNPNAHASFANPLNSLRNLAVDPLTSSAEAPHDLAAYSSYASYNPMGAYGMGAYPTAAQFGSPAAYSASAAAMYAGSLGGYSHPYGWMRGPYQHGAYGPGAAVGPGGKKGRQTYQRWQTTHLESAYLQNRYVTKKHRNELVAITNLSDRQVKIWFQNRRMKDKKDKKREEEEKELEKSKAASSSLPGPSSHVELQDSSAFYPGHGHYPPQSHYKPAPPRELPPAVQPLAPYSWPPQNKAEPSDRA